jgi:hypothetical protein
MRWNSKKLMAATATTKIRMGRMACMGRSFDDAPV